MQLKSGRGRGFTCMTLGKCSYYIEHVPEWMPFSLTVVPSYYHFFASHSRIVWIWFYLETSSLEPFSLFYDLIAPDYTKEKWQCRQGYLFCFESYHFDKKMFLYICLFLSISSEEFT